MEIKNNSVQPVQVLKPVTSKHPDNQIKKSDIDVPSTSPKDNLHLETEQYIKSININFIDLPLDIKFVDFTNRDTTKSNLSPKSTDLQTNSALKTNFNEKSKIISAEINKFKITSTLPINNSADNNFSSKDLKPVTVESELGSGNIKGTFDPKAQKISTEMSTGESIKIKTDFDTKKAQLGKISIESKNQNTNISANYNTTNGAVDSQISNGDSNKFTLSGGYNLKKSSLDKVEIKYNHKDIEVGAKFSDNKNVNLSAKSNDVEINTNFALNNSSGFRSVQVVKPVSFGENIPSAKLQFDYSLDKKDPKIGLGIEMKILDKASITYSSNFASPVKKHSVGVKYDLSEHTNISLDTKIDQISSKNSETRLMFNSSFKF